MGEPNYVNVSIQTAGVVPTATRGTGKVGMVGYATTSASAVREHSSLSDIQTIYGADSDIAKSAALAIRNGANPLIISPATPGTNGVYSAPADSTTFTELTLDDFPIPQTVVVTAGSAGTLVQGDDENAGADYYVDVGNKKLIFYDTRIQHSTTDDAPNLQFNYAVTYKQYDATEIGAALTALESSDVNFVFVAQANGVDDVITGVSNTLQAHITATATGDKPRLGIVANKYGVATTTLATALASDRMIIIHHKSYQDVAAIAAGVLSTLQPQESLLLKPVVGDGSTGNFTDAEYVTFKTNQINALVKHSRIPTPQFRFTESFTLSSDPFKKYIDSMRVIDDTSFKIKAALISPDLLGTVKLGTIPGMNRLRTIVNGTLQDMVNIGEIDSYSFEIPGEEIVRKAVADRTPEEVAKLANYISSRTFSVLISIVYTGAVHYLDPVKITYSGT